MADSSAPLGEIEVVVRALLDKYEQDLAKARRAAEEFNQQVAQGFNNQANPAMQQSISHASTLHGWWQRLKFAAMGAIGVFGVNSLRNYADTWSDLNSLLAANVGGQEAATVAMERLEVVARRTYSSLQQTTQSFVFNARALRDMGRSTREQLDFSESLNNALVVSGARGQRAAAVQNALSKAMGLGRLQGQELNTVMSMGGRVAEVLAEELDVTVSKLKELSPQGKITADVIANALIKNLETLREEADAMPATLADAFTLMGNAVLSFVGRVDKAFGTTESMAVSMVGLADTIRGAAAPAIRLIQVAVDLFNGALLDMQRMFVSLGWPTDSAQRFGQALLIGATSAIAMMGAVKALSGAIDVLNWVMRANPIMLLITGIGAAIAAIWLFRDEISRALGVDVTKIFGDVANFLIKSFLQAFEVLKFMFMNFPDVLAAAVAAAVNGVIGAIEFLINTALRNLRRFIQDVGGLMRALSLIPGMTGLLGAAQGISGLFGDEVKLGRVESKFTGATTPGTSRTGGQAPSPLQAHQNRLTAIQNTDYVQWLTDVVNGTGEAAAASANLDEILSTLSETTGGLTEEQKKLKEAYDGIVDSAYRFIEQQEIERQTIGMSQQEANAFRYEMDMLNRAIDAGIKLTPQQVLQLQDLAAGMAVAEEQTRLLREQFEFAKSTTSEFVMTLKNGLQQGQGFFESFVSAAMRVLDKLVDKLLNDVIDAIFEMGSVLRGQGGAGGFLTTLLGGLFGGGMGATTGMFYRKGGVQSGRGISAFSNSVVSRPTLFPFARGVGLMGEAGHEGILPLRRMPSGNLGVEASGAAGGAVYNDNRVYHIDARGAQRGVAEEIRAQLEAYDKHVMPNRAFEEVNRRIGAGASLSGRAT